MFDLSSSKLLILGIVALLVVGPRDLPILLRTVGKYVGMLRRQAAEFRTQFDDAMRESELDQIKKDVETMGADMEKTMREAEMSVEKEVATANAELEASMAKDAPPAFGQLDNLGATEPVASPSPAPVADAKPAVTPATEKVGV
jgi:sec-independent protein translocase protein TatB